MRLSLFVLLSFIITSVSASIPITGEFIATKACPAYVSKNYQSNPDLLQLEVGKHYKMLEINKDHPDWVRLLIPNIHQAARWVKMNCGQPLYKEIGNARCDNTAGQADSYVLAVSLQPGFCKTHGYEVDKPECLHLAPKNFAFNHLVLHGLWPNEKACGVSYGFCNAQSKASFCDYKPLDLQPEVAKDLDHWMPSFHYGSCLERHEWNKHGSCQTRPVNDYFSLAMRLTKEVNDTALGHYLSEHVGMEVSRASLRKVISDSFGEESVNKIFLGCHQGYLVDIYIQLPKVLDTNQSLENLVSQAAEFTHPEGCSLTFRISDFYPK